MVTALLTFPSAPPNPTTPQSPTVFHLSSLSLTAASATPATLAAVQRGDDLLYPQTTASSRFLRLPSTAWATAGGADAAGEDVVIGVVDSGVWPEHDSFSSKDVVIGVVDSGIWPEHDSFSSKGDWAGENVVTGVADSGIWPEWLWIDRNQAFTAAVNGGCALTLALSTGGRAGDLYGGQPVDFKGVCTVTSDFPACNTKVLGARYLYQGLLKSGRPIDLTVDYLSPRDVLGHGSWCAGAAAGNRYIKAVGGPFTRHLGAASGMAPRARIAVYKVVWRTQLVPGVSGVDRPGGVASLVDVEAAVDFAIQDNIDVLLVPLSAGFSPTASYFDHVPYLNAFEGGVTVVKPAGNRGLMLGVRTIENYSPFYLTVGARRQHASVAALASTVEGVRLTGDWSRAQFHPMAPAASAALSAAARKKASQCMPGSLNPLLALGKVLVCGPGGTTPQKKIAAAARAGARGVVLTSADADGGEEDEDEGGGGVEVGMGEDRGSGEGSGSGGLGGEGGGASGGANGANSTGGGSGDSLRGRSTVEAVGGAAGGARDMAAAGGGLPVMELNAETSALLGIRLQGLINLFSPLLWLRFLQPLRPPVIDSTSSTGPVALPLARPGGSQPTNDLLKPDLIAPGVMLWAAAPGGARTNRFRRLSGTSMAAAHVAGVLALVIQENPTWLPGRVMSAVLTTAKPTNVYGRPIRLWNGLQADPWMMGSGHVNPSKVLNPGLSFDLLAADFKNLLAGQNPKRTAKIFPTATLEPIDAIQLNRPSIAISHCAGTVTVARTVTNVGTFPATFVAKVKPPFLTIVEVVPPRITLSPGDSYRFLVSISGLVPRPRWNFVYGAIVFKDNYGRKVRIPITVQPSLL
ncbi:unnamed protein product [Closterium sp. Yama58-4]|nr:unnamed protein product [Closterium sp. Yama58-4]